MEKNIVNYYSISFLVNNIEYGHYLRTVKINKNVTGAQFTDDVFIFDTHATDLLNFILTDAEIEISLNQNNNYKTIYKSKGIISDVIIQDDMVFVFIESERKINWLRKNGVSLTAENINVYDFIKKFINKVDQFYHLTPSTSFKINYEKNINKYSYENLIAPIKKSNFDTLKSICETYYILNSPFYIYFDDYDFTDKNNFSINVFDFSNIRSLRAVVLDDLKTPVRPLLKSTRILYDSNVYFKTDKMQKIYKKIDEYSLLKPEDQLRTENRFNFIEIADDTAGVQQRTENTQQFFKKASFHYIYRLTDIDVTKFVLGYRYVDNAFNATIQYSQAIVEATFIFNNIGKDNVLENKPTSVANQFIVAVEFKTITN